MLRHFRVETGQAQGTNSTAHTADGHLNRRQPPPSNRKVVYSQILSSLMDPNYPATTGEVIAGSLGGASLQEWSLLWRFTCFMNPLMAITPTIRRIASSS